MSGFYGCEPFLNGVVAALAGLKRDEISNVLLRRGDAQAVIKAVPDAFFSRIFMLYPDPWPKRRHHKRRVVSVGFIAALARVMRKGAEFRFATDIDDYAGCDPFSLSRFSRTSAGLPPEPRIGACLGLDGVQRAMRRRRVSMAGGPFTLLSCVCEKKDGSSLQRRIT